MKSKINFDKKCRAPFNPKKAQTWGTKAPDICNPQTNPNYLMIFISFYLGWIGLRNP